MKLTYQLFSSLPKLGAACPPKERRQRACEKELQAWQGQAIRQPGPSEWGSCDRGRAARPSAPPALSSPPLIVRPWTSRGGFTPFSPPCPDPGSESGGRKPPDRA